MIKVNRSNKPAVLSRNERKWLRDLLNASSRVAHDRAEKKYSHYQIRRTLVQMFSGKCAYCESRIIHVNYPHIEHYRPKSTYPRHTFQWRNLLLSCGVCNSTAWKGNKFPLASANGPIINPCNEDPSIHLDFNFDPITFTANVDGRTPRGKTTELLLGLNRGELLSHRSLFVKKLYVLAFHAATDPEARRLLADAKKSDAEYAAFARKIP